MGRWAPDAASRLAAAAVTLFEDCGYDQTTVADIALAAGLTERTFFRHFTDKREVLFAGTADLRATMTASVAGAPPGSSPLAAVTVALEAGAAFFADRQSHARRRQHVLAATPVLAEREASKMGVLVDDLAAALRGRGVDEPTATLTAEIGVLTFRTAFLRWLDQDGGSLADVYPSVLAEVREVAGAG